MRKRSREILASIGARSLDDVIGRADLLGQVSRGSDHLDDLDPNPLLIKVDGSDSINYDRDRPRNAVLTHWMPKSFGMRHVSQTMVKRCSCPMRCKTRIVRWATHLKPYCP